MSSAGRELHAAGPGDAPPAQRPASPGLCAAPGSAGEWPDWALPREPHGRDLDDREPLRRPPLALAGQASRPEQRRRREMRGGGLETPGWCEEGLREGARPGLPTCGGNGRPGEEEFQLIQKGRERVSSPSCLETKDLLQNPEENPAKVQVVSEKQSRLPKAAPGMTAEGTGLPCNMGEPRAQARTGVLLEASQCSGGVAVSGNGSFVSQKPLSPASSEEEELPAFARQAAEETFQNPGQEMNAVFNSRPSVQQETFGTPSKHSLAPAWDACPPGTRLETTGQAFEGSTPWSDRMDLSEAAREVQEGSLRSSPSGGRMEDLGEASELQMAEAPLQAGSPRRELSDVEHKGDDSVDLFSSPVHKGIIDIQKGSAVHGCWKGGGERFPSEHGRFLTPAKQLTGPKDRHSEIGCSSLCDVVQAAFEDELRESSSEASSVQEDRSSSLSHEKSITLGKGNGALLLKRNNFGFFQNRCSIKSVSAFLSCVAPQLNLGGNGLPLRAEPKDNLRTALLLCDLALPRCATSSFRVTEIGVCADEKSLKVPQLHGPSPFAQKAEPGSGHGGPMDSLSPEGVIVMRSTGAWLHHKEACALSQASGRLQAVMNEGAWEMVRWVLTGAENGEVAMEPFWRKALRFSDRTMNDLSSAPEEIYALARNLFLDCKNLQRDRRGAATQISFSLGISPALLESSARFFSLQKCFSCSPYRNNWVALDRAGSPLGSVHPLEVPCSNLPTAEAENQRVDGGDAFGGSESILERKSNVFPPYGRIEIHKASFGADAGGIKTIGNATVHNNIRLFFQLAFDGDLSKTFFLCRATFRKGQCLEEEETYRILPSSPACHLSYLIKKGSSLCTKHSTQQRKPIYQMKIFLYPCYFLDCCTLFEQKSDSPKTEFLECQQPSLIFYNKLNHHDLQTVVSSAIKYVRCNKNESLHSKMELKVTPPATALLTEYHQGPFQEIIVESSNNNTGSEFTGNQLTEDFLESQSPRTLFRCSDSTSELLNRNDFVKNQGQSKTDDLHSASESVHKSLSEKFNIINGLLSASKLVSSAFQTGPRGQERMKGLLLKSYRKRKIPSLISAGLGSQNKKMCLFPKEAALMSPSLKAHGSPPAQRHCRGALLLEREADGRSRPFGLGSERLSSSPRQDAAAACPLTRKRTCQRFKGPSGGAPVSLYPLEQSLEAKQDLEAGPIEAGRTARMAEGFLVRILSDSEESSEALLENVMLPFRGGKVTFSFKSAIHPGLPLGLSEGISESDSRKATDSPEPSVTWGHVESPSCVLQAKLFSSSMKAAETLCSSVSSSGLKGGRLASFPTGPSMKEGRLLKVESGQELAGGSEKGLEGHMVTERIGRGDSEAGPQLPPPKAKPQVGRRPATRQPPGNVSDENAARPTLASLGRTGQKRRQQEPPFHTRSESKRQKRGRRWGETASKNLHFRNRSRQANRWPSSIGAFGCFARAVGCHQSRSTGIFGYLHLRRPFPAFGKVACIKVGMPHRLRAPKPLASKGPSETFPGEKGQLVYSAQLATEPAAPQAILWDPPAKQQGHRSSSLASFWLTGQSKDAALLTRLSWLAEKLLAPPCQPFPPRRVLLPSAAKWGPLRRRRRLLEIFSFVSLKLSSPPWLSSCCFKMAGSQALPVYSVESTILCCFELSSDSSCGCSTPVFPVSFPHQMDVDPTGKLPKTGSPSLIPRFALGHPQPQQPSVWSLSFLLPQRCPDITGPIQKDADPGSVLASKEGEAVARSAGCPTPGLPTALALFSPGCYRAWTRRRRHPSSRIPAVQWLSRLQFARGLKGFQCCTSVSADLFPSLASSLGSVLSIWSQHGPSTHLSESTALHSGPSKGQAALPATAGLSHRSSLSLPPLVPRLPSDTSRAVKNDVRLESILSVLLPTSCQAPEPAHPPLGFPALGSGDGDEASVPASPKTGAQLEKDESENRPKKVSQIRIRKTIPKPDPNLTPMGLPRPKRLKKTEFSLEEIYTNQNYKSPPATRCLETIFEEPKEKNGSLISISQQKRKRILEFQDFTIPRKRRARSRVRVMSGYTRAQKAAIEGRELDVLLIQKLTDLETFFAKEETQEQASSGS